MESVLLHLTRKRDRRKLEDWLGTNYQLILPAPEKPFEGPFDLAIVDGTSLSALEPAIKSIREDQAPVFLPFLLLTRQRLGAGTARHLGRSVDDIIVRPVQEAELLARTANLLRMRRWSLDLKKEHDRAMRLAVTDDVSGFHNTRYLHRSLDRLIGDEQKPVEVCLVFFDMDNFKALVDAHGHLLGSKTLKEVANAVHKVLDPDDRIVRYGGDEFVVVLRHQNRVEAVAKAVRMRDAIANTSFLHKEGIDARLTASFGVACYPSDAKNKHELLAQADRCLFKSKSVGKNLVTAVDPENVAPDAQEDKA